MDLTMSFEAAVPARVRARYDLRETRNAAAVIAATNPGSFAEVVEVLRTCSCSTIIRQPPLRLRSAVSPGLIPAPPLPQAP